MLRANRTLLSIGLVLFLAPPAAALWIDDFEAGGFTLTDLALGGPTTTEQSGLGAVGGSRLVSAESTGLLGSASADLVLTGGDDGAVLSAATSGGDFSFTYDGIANGVSDGQAGALGLDLSGLTSIVLDAVATGSGATAQLTLWSVSAQESSAALPVSTGAIIFDLSGFSSVDLSALTAIRVAVAGLTAGDSATFTGFSAVPEPSTALLLALGLAAVGWRRRYRG